MNNNQFGKNNPNYKHGDINTRLYNIWHGIKQRCLYPKFIGYKNYGGRGITICNEWLEFIPFRDWALNNGYADNLEIDRINTNGNYEPSNCRFITHKENVRNRRNNAIKNKGVANEIRGLGKTEKYTRKELAEKFNVSISIINQIINNKIWMD